MKNMLYSLPFFEVGSVNIHSRLLKRYSEKHIFHVEICAAAQRRNGGLV